MEKKRNRTNNMAVLNVGSFYQILMAFLIILEQDNYATACRIYPKGEYIKLVKVPKNLEKGSEIFPLEVHPRDHLKFVSADREKDSQYFSYREVNKTHISVILDESLENLVDDNSANNLLKFRIICNSSFPENESLIASLSVTILVEDINNHTPKFIGTPYQTTLDELTAVEFRGNFISNLPEFEVDFYNISIVENLPNGFSVLQVVAYDRDQGENVEFRYELEDASGAFSIEPNSGWLIVRDESILDREKRSLIKMKVFAVQRVPSAFSSNNSLRKQPKIQKSSVDVEVTLLDVNDNSPVFVPSNLYEFVAQSDLKVGTVLGQVHAVDKDQGRNGLVFYHLQQPGNSTSNFGAPFQVDPKTGAVSVIESPVIGRHVVFVEASDQPLNPSERRSSLAVVAIDVYPSDGLGTEIPGFIGAPYEFWVGIDVPIGTTVGQIRTNNAVRTVELLYDLLHDYHEGVPFAIEETSGTITVVDQIRKYNRLLYDFEAITTNEKDINLITNVSIHVVLDSSTEKMGSINHGTTEAPLIFHIRENCGSAFIGQVLPAQNETLSHNIHFFIANQQDVPISITDDGSLYTNDDGLDREKKENYSLTIVAEHSGGIGIFQVRVIIDDENDNAPVFTSTSYEGHILENSPPGTKVTMKNDISAHDSDDGINSSFIISLQGDVSNMFEIDQNTGEVFYSGNKKLDREMKSEYNMKIAATDTGNLKSEADLIITIDDVNDNPPNFIEIVVLDHNLSKETGDNLSLKEGSNDSQDYHEKELILNISENVTLGSSIIRLVAIDEDQDNEIRYEVSENKANKTRFFIDSRSGEISVIRSLRGERDIDLDVRARDSGNLTDQMRLKIRVKGVNDDPVRGLNDHLFMKSLYMFQIKEGVYDQYKIGTITFNCSKANITYEFDHPDNDVEFNIGKDGDLLVSGILDSQQKNLYKFILKARQNGKDVSSTTNLEIQVLENQPVFKDRYYEIEVEENSEIPLKLLQLRSGNLKDLDYRIADSFVSNYFSIDSKNGTLYLIKPVDREERDYYEIVVRVNKVGKQSRGLPVMIYPVGEERLGLANEAKVIVKIKDVNDNAPKFKIADAGRPLVGVITTGAHFGYEIMKVEAEDADEGINGEIRYQILSNEKEETQRFAIDPVSGEVKSISNFARDVGRVFGFDVKATDRQGAEDGISSIINVIVYVLDDEKQVVMNMPKRPSEIDKQMENITMVLKNITGYDVRIRKLEPHIEKNLIDNASSDVYLYAIDPNLNVIIDTEILHDALRSKRMEIKRELDVLDITKNPPRRKNQRYLLSTLEVGVVVLGCVVFIITLITALCVTCLRRNNKRNTPTLGFALRDATGNFQKPFFPSVLDLQSLQYDTEIFSSDVQPQNLSDYESNAARFNRIPSGTAVGKHPMRFETSATSLYSSGQDSGIVARICHCSNFYSPSSGDSSNGYEDSLKSFQQNINSSDNDIPHIQSLGRPKLSSRKRPKHQVFSNLESSATAHQDLRLSPEKRYRPASMGQKERQIYSLGRNHRIFAEAENNITERVIYESPGMELLIPGSRTNTLRVGTRRSQVLY